MNDFVNSLFLNLDFEYYIEENASTYIVGWFLSQTKLPHTEAAIKALVREIFHAHPESFTLERALKAEELTLEYWGGDFYPENLDWDKLFSTTDNPLPFMLRGPGKIDPERFKEETVQFEKKFKSALVILGLDIETNTKTNASNASTNVTTNTFTNN